MTMNTIHETSQDYRMVEAECGNKDCPTFGEWQTTELVIRQYDDNSEDTTWECDRCLVEWQQDGYNPDEWESVETYPLTPSK